MSIRSNGPSFRSVAVAGVRPRCDVNGRVFFYGLYMDSSLLEDMGFRPNVVGIAKLPDYQIHIGDRATLIPTAGSDSYGVLMDLPGEAASALYSRPEVAGYRAEPVDVILLDDGTSQRSWCYILPQEKLGSGTNTGYANKLAALVAELGLPLTYAHDISRFGSGT